MSTIWSKGKLVYPENGNVFEGLFTAGKMHGRGTMKYGNGDVYSGTWKNDNIHGILCNIMPCSVMSSYVLFMSVYSFVSDFSTYLLVFL